MTKRTQAILGLSGVFLIGAVCGALVFGVVMRDRAREAVGLRSREGFVHHFERRLQLSETQRDSLKDELERTYSQMAVLREETSQRYNTLIDTLVARIMPTLTEDQRVLFRDQEEHFRRFLPKEKKGPGGPGPRPPRSRDGAGAPAGALQPPATAASRVPLAGSARVAEPRTASPAEIPVSVIPPPLAQVRPADTTTKSPCYPLKSCASLNQQQPTGESENRPLMEVELKKIQGRLGLSEEQAASLKTIMADTRQTIKKIRTEDAERPAQKRRRVGETMQQMDQQIMNLLTADQQQRWITMREEMGERFKYKKRRIQDRDTTASGG